MDSQGLFSTKDGMLMTSICVPVDVEAVNQEREQKETVCNRDQESKAVADDMLKGEADLINVSMDYIS